ncbi:hypothetical protein ACP4OV_003903 [Aristida adscensionis]
MAGWMNSTGTGPGTGGGGGRGAGGRGFPNHRNTTDVIHGGGGGGGGGGRWRERSRGRPPPQPHYRYRPVEAAHRHSPPAPAPPQHHYASAAGPAASSTSTRHAHIASSADKSSTSVAGAPASASSTREPEDKASRNAANFECNVCFDMAAEPVVTKCGHLFCWECLYQWLHVHSHHRECPVCKGQVADDAIIPIYGRGGSAASVNNAPPRPTGVRVESARQQHQHQLHTVPHPMVYLEEEEEEDPFDFGGVNFGFASGSIRDAVMSFMPSNVDDMDMADQYDDYTNDHEADEFEDIYDYQLLGFPLFPSLGPGAEAGNPSSSQAHPELINLTDSINGLYHHRDFSHSGANTNNRGRHGYGRRNRVRARSSASADHPTDALVMGSSLSFYNDTSAASHNVSASRSTRPNGGWAERRGRSNRNSNSAGGRGMQDSRRTRTTYYN